MSRANGRRSVFGVWAAAYRIKRWSGSGNGMTVPVAEEAATPCIEAFLGGGTEEDAD